MSTTNYSFSVKNEDDIKLVERLKQENRAYGRSFSHVVLSALREYEKKRVKETPNEAK